MEFARKGGFEKVLFLTVSVHRERVERIASRFSEIYFEVLSSEDIVRNLSPEDSAAFSGREEMKAYRRTRHYENVGLKKLRTRRRES